MSKENQNLTQKAPVVVVMGHIDHGKTSLLDQIRKTHIAEKESGGITQHIGAYQIEKDGKKITFIDTPGHEAFSAMRVRGAKVADIAILVIDVSEGVPAKTGQGVEDLLEMILLVVEMENLRVDVSAPAEGVIIESYLDKQRGPTATLILE